MLTGYCIFSLHQTSKVFCATHLSSLVVDPTTEILNCSLMNLKRNRFDEPDNRALDTTAKRIKHIEALHYLKHGEDEDIFESCCDQITVICDDGIEKDCVSPYGSNGSPPHNRVEDRTVMTATPSEIHLFLQSQPAGHTKSPMGGVSISKLTAPRICKVSHRRRMDEYFSIPMPSLSIRSEIYDVQHRPSAKLRGGDREDGSLEERTEPTTTEDRCECCLRLVSDLTLSHRCCFCTKVGCLECMKSCEACIEFFCSHCSTRNYSSTYERTLCLDCDCNAS